MVSLDCLAKHPQKPNQEFFETDYDMVADELINNPDVSVSGMYETGLDDNSDQINTINLLNMDDDMLSQLIDKADDSDPLVYRSSHQKTYHYMKTNYQYTEKYMMKQIWKCMNYI